MKFVLHILSVFWLWTCSDGGDKATGPEEPPIVVNLTSLTGQAQKGPFNNGTSINVAELNNTLSPTGRNFSSAITDNTGRFSVANVQLESPFVELRATGFYFNEVSNNISDAQLTLYALSDLTNKTSLNVNILTHLEKNRMQVLMSGDNPKTFAQAKLQAQEEVLAIFDYSRANMPASELLDISQGGAANAKLLAISAILQGDQTVGQMSELLANISTDLSTDGALDDSSLQSQLISNTQGLDFTEIRSNLSARFTALGITATIPDFETEINQFLKPPVAQDMSVSTGEDTPINITLAASDPEDESLTYTILEVNNATVTLNGNVATYTPDAHFNGTDTFTFYANDGTSDSNIATVTMTVSAEDDEPNTLDVATSTDEDVAVAVNLSAEEYDGDSYSFAIITDVSNGTTSLNGSTVTYTPNQDWNGTDTFTFEATDDRTARTNVATATITVNPVNDAPVANDITNQVTDENRMMQLDITLDATDVDGDALTYNITSTNNGSVTINDNIATYVPTQDWNGEDTFTYIANDGSLNSNTATVTIKVNSIPDAPITYNFSVETNEDFGLYGQIPLGEHSFDVDGDDLVFIVSSIPTNGNLCQDAGAKCGTVLAVGDTITGENGTNTTTPVYEPYANFNGSDSFSWKVNDGSLDSNIGTVSITVNPILDLFSVKDAAFEVDEDNELQVNIDDSYIGTNPDNLSMNDIYFSISPQNGTVTNTGILMMYAPNDNFNGTDTFAYRGSHIAGGNATNSDWSINEATITITVNPIDDLPKAIDFTASTAEDNSVDITLQHEDVDGDTWPDLTYEIWTQPSNGSVVLDATKKIATYTPNGGFFGTDEFVYSTEAGSSESGTVTVTVEEVVGDLTIFPDLTEGYSERFSDIVYDNSTGGYIVAGYSHHKNDSSGPPWNVGGTWNMFKLSADSFMDTQVYEHLDFQSSVIMYNEKQNSVHGFDISRVSHNGSYLLSSGGDYLWSVDSDGSSVFSERINQISGYSGIENISNTFQLPSGNFVILASIRLDNDTSGQKYPIIAEIDQSLNILHYKILDNHITDNSVKYDSYYNRMVYNHNDGVVYVIAQTNIIGFNNSNQLNYYEVAIGSNAFNVNRYENLSDISGSPTQMYIQGENSDVMTYKRNSNGYDEFVLMTEEDSTDQLMLVYYRLMDNGSKEIIETFYPNHSGNHDFMELVDSGNRYYLVAQEGNDIRVQSVFDTENFSTSFDKLLDITSLGFEDKLGGATASNFYNNASGLAITGSTRKDSTEDWDGFILLLDLSGE